MSTFNEKMTIEEATQMFKFKGTAMFPNTRHNREMMALVVEAHLKALQGK